MLVTIILAVTVIFWMRAVGRWHSWRNACADECDKMFAARMKHLIRQLAADTCLTAVRSRSRSNSPPGCDSLRSRRFATLKEKAY